MTTKEEIVLMKQRMNSVEEKLDKMDSKLDMLTEKLLDPDYGVVARVNKNTSFRKKHDEAIPAYNTIIDEFRSLQRWKSTVTKALWGLYAAVIGYIVKLIFW
jgi:tetrahydromethanopterin S-methyltransferase subunit G